MMEYMGLCGDPTAFRDPENIPPAPCGVPMGITIMPEFIVDIQKELIQSASPRSLVPRGPKPFDIGSRAGRLAWVLHNFAGENNAWYMLNYIAKVGELGGLILKQRFIDDAKQSGVRPMSLRFVFPRATSDWIAFYKMRGNRSSRSIRSAETRKKDISFTEADLEGSPYMTEDLFADTRYLVISTKNPKQAANAIKIAAQGLLEIQKKRKFRPSKPSSEHQEVTTNYNLSPEPKGFKRPLGILLDLPALEHRKDARIPLTALRTACTDLTEFYQIHVTILTETRDVDLKLPLSQDLEANILLRGHSSMTLHAADWTETARVRFQPSATSSQLICREAFLAGYILATACELGWRLLRHWYHYFPGLRPLSNKPHSGIPCDDSAGAPLQPEDGSALLPSPSSEAPPFNGHERLTLGRLFGVAAKDGVLTYEELIIKQPANFQQTKTGLSDREVKVAKHIKYIGSLDGKPAATTLKKSFDQLKQELEAEDTYSCVPRFSPSNIQPSSSLYIPCGNPDALVVSCQLRDLARAKRSNQGPVKRAVMFDLDSTLLDSAALRRACWRKALSVFFIEAIQPTGGPPRQGDITNVLRIYEGFVYEKARDWKSYFERVGWTLSEQEPFDFRQVWNHRYAWAILLWLIENPKTDETEDSEVWDSEVWRELADAHNPDKANRGECTCSSCEKLKKLFDDREASWNLRNLKVRLMKYSQAVSAARTAFWDVDFPAFPHARACLETLVSDPAVRVYIVTEGHEETQIKKIKCIGLDDLVPAQRVLTTSAASSRHDAAKDLEDLVNRHKRVKTIVERFRQCTGGAPCPLASAELVKHQESLNAAGVLGQLLERFNKKQDEAFYSAVIDSIRLDPEAPAELLQSARTRRIVGEGSLPLKVKFFMIGDRYDNDLKQLLRLLAPQEQGGRPRVGTIRLLSGKHAGEHCPPEDKLPIPQYFCDTLAQCMIILNSQRAWEEIEDSDAAMPPILLRVKEDEICCDLQGATENLVSNWGHLAWAFATDEIQRAGDLIEIIPQISRDIAICPPKALSRLLNQIAPELDAYWAQASPPTPEQEGDPHASGPDAVALREIASAKYRGSLELLERVNSYRSDLLQDGNLEDHEPARQQLAWTLGAHLLKRLDVGMIPLRRGSLTYANMVGPRDLNPNSILRAIPYCSTGKAIVEHSAVRGAALLGISCKTWLSNAKDLKIQ